MNLKKLFLGAVFLLSSCVLHAQSTYFMWVPKQQGFESFKRILSDNGFELQIWEGSTYVFNKTSKAITTEIVVVSPPTGDVTDVMYEYAQEGVKTSHLYKNISKEAIDNFGKPHIKTSKEMGWFFSDYSIVVMKDKAGVSMVWTKSK